MARTLSGNFTGRAAVIEAQDQREAMQLSAIGFKSQVMETAQKVSDLAGASLYNTIWTAAPNNDRAFYEHMKDAHAWLLLLSPAELETARELATRGLDYPQITHAINNKRENAKYNEKRAAETKAFLARMNAPEMVERRGTVLTPYGWRKPQ